MFFYSVLLSHICTYIPSVCNFLHLVLLAVSFAVINFMFSLLLGSSICKCFICSSRKNTILGRYQYKGSGVDGCDRRYMV